MKRKFALLIVAIITISLVVGIYKIGIQIGIINANKLIIHTANSLSENEVIIIKSFFSINRINDSELFDSYKESDVVYKSENKKTLVTEYGENDFLIIYNQKYYYQFRYFKTDDIKNNKFTFDFSKKDTNIIIQVTIEPKQMNFEGKMNLTSNAGLFKTNIPIDNAGSNYNMRELRKTKLSQWCLLPRPLVQISI